MDTNECYVYFGLYGDEFEPNDVTEYLGVQPTSVRRKGEKVPNKLPRNSSWQLSTKNVVNELIEVEVLASEVIDVLRPKTDLINEIRQKLNLVSHLEVVMRITTDDSQSTPAFYLPAQQIQFLAAVEAFIDVDIYRA